MIILNWTCLIMIMSYFRSICSSGYGTAFLRPQCLRCLATANKHDVPMKLFSSDALMNTVDAFIFDCDGVLWSVVYVVLHA